MRYLSLLLVVFAIITLVCPASAKPMYEAATRVMDMQSHLNGADRLRQLSDLAALAKSQTVIQRTADTLIRLQVTTDPFSVLSTVDARPIEDTNILAITVQADSEDVAKATAGIVACEFIRYYDEFTENTLARGSQTRTKAYAMVPGPGRTGGRRSRRCHWTDNRHSYRHADSKTSPEQAPRSHLDSFGG